MLFRSARGVRGRASQRDGERLHCGSCAADMRKPAAALGAAGFFRARIRCAVDARMARTRSRSVPVGDGPCARCGERIADGGRCSGLRCARRRGHGDMGGDASARSRRQPQAHACGSDLRSHRAAAAGGGDAIAFDGGDTVDRAPGALAAMRGVAGVGRACVRDAACPQPSWPDRPMDHGVEL